MAYQQARALSYIDRTTSINNKNEELQNVEKSKSFRKEKTPKPIVVPAFEERNPHRPTQPPDWDTDYNSFNRQVREIDNQMNDYFQ